MADLGDYLGISGYRSKKPGLISPPYELTEIVMLNSNDHSGISPGIIYMSQIPPYMRPEKVRHLVSRFGEVGRIYLKPENSMTRDKRRRQGGKKKLRFLEGWVEMKNKTFAKQTAHCLNNTNIGGKKKNYHYFDMWNVKYLHRFKWFHLTESIAYQKAVREQRLRTDLSQVKRENEFYLQSVEKGKEINAIDRRNKMHDKHLVDGTQTNHPQGEILSGIERGRIENIKSVTFLTKVLPNSIS